MNVTSEIHHRAAKERKSADRLRKLAAIEFTGAGLLWSLAGIFKQNSGEASPGSNHNSADARGRAITRIGSIAVASLMAATGIKAVISEVRASALEGYIRHHEASYSAAEEEAAALEHAGLKNKLRIAFLFGGSGALWWLANGFDKRASEAPQDSTAQYASIGASIGF